MTTSPTTSRPASAGHLETSAQRENGGQSSLGPFRAFSKDQLKMMVKAAGKDPAGTGDATVDPAAKRHKQCFRYYTLGVLGLPMKLSPEAMVNTLKMVRRIIDNTVLIRHPSASSFRHCHKKRLMMRGLFFKGFCYVLQRLWCHFCIIFSSILIVAGLAPTCPPCILHC